MIRYTQGNLLEADAEALVNTINEVGVMGKGIALMFRESFPENTRQYENACKIGGIKVGSIFVTANDALIGPKWILNFPTKKHWRNPSKLEWIRSGLVDLVNVIRANKIRSIAIPPLGCGNGGLDWRDVRPLIELAMSELPDTEALIFAPITHYLNLPKSKGVEKLTAARAMIAELTRRYSILGMECSNLEIQKLAWFLNRSLEKLRIENPLKLEFSPNKYGPYADNLRHLLESMDGSYLQSEKRISDSGAFDPVAFNESRRVEVVEFLQSEGQRQYLEAIDSTHRVIKGFESPLGMELLATVDWLLCKSEIEPNVAAIKAGLANWPAGPGSAGRKLHLFDDRMIDLAIARLVSEMV
jgi:O-acetyl-ADP-ribose deacetylase (regulator of RNase III)